MERDRLVPLLDDATLREGTYELVDTARADRLVAGRVADPGAGSSGQPLAGPRSCCTARAALWRSLCPRRIVIAVRICTRRTDDDGRVLLQLRAGPSRILRLSFGGDRLPLPASRTAILRTPARVRFEALPRAVSAGGLAAV